MRNPPTQTWVTDTGGFMSRNKNERDAEVARLYYIEGMRVTDIAPLFGISVPRVGQIIRKKRFAEMRREWAMTEDETWA